MNSVDLFTFALLTSSLAVPVVAFLVVTVGGQIRAALATKRMLEAVRERKASINW